MLVGKHVDILFNLGSYMMMGIFKGILNKFIVSRQRLFMSGSNCLSSGSFLTFIRIKCFSCIPEILRISGTFNFRTVFGNEVKIVGFLEKVKLDDTGPIIS